LCRRCRPQVQTTDEALSSAAHGPEARRQALGLAPGAADAAWRSRSGPGSAQGEAGAPAPAGGGQAADILSYEQRKAARARELQSLLQPGSPGEPPPPAPD
jgi:hypothetical protein